jgi:hypothetical protein
MKKLDHVEERGGEEYSGSYRKSMREFELDSSGSEYGPVAGCSEHANEMSGLVKC